MRLLPESGQVLLAAAILSGSIILRPAPPVIAETAAPETSPVVVEPAVVNVEIIVPENAPPVVNVTIPESSPPVINVDVQMGEPTTVIVEPAPVLPAEIIYKDRVVEVERIVEVRSCLDYSDLPYFDLANALSRAFPGAQWSLSGSHYPGLVWHDEQPKPDMTQIIGGWLAHLAADC